MQDLGNMRSSFLYYGIVNNIIVLTRVKGAK